MTTDIAIRGQASDLTVRDDQTFWSDKQLAALNQLGVKDAPQGDLAVFFHQTVRTGLDPFLKQIYMIGRNAKEGNQWVTKYTIQTGIDGYRLIARRVVDARLETLEYEDTLWCGDDGRWVDVWLSSDAPSAAKVTVLRNGKRFPAVALWREYVQLVNDRDGGGKKPNSMWERMGANQLAKCAEALALRKAFPQDLSGIYTTEEMGQAENDLGAHQPAAALPSRAPLSSAPVEAQSRPGTTRRRPPPNQQTAATEHPGSNPSNMPKLIRAQARGWDARTLDDLAVATVGKAVDEITDGGDANKVMDAIRAHATPAPAAASEPVEQEMPF